MRRVRLNTSMPKTPLKTKNHRVLAYIEVDSRGRHTIYDHTHRILGYYDPRTNRTTDRVNRIVGYGYLMAALIPGELAEDGGDTIKPKPPLTPEQARREADRRASVQKQIRDETLSSGKKRRDLQAKLAWRP